MSQPIVFISRNKIREGRAEEFREHYNASIPPTIASKTGTLAQVAYENEETAEVTVVHFFADADALDLQLEGAEQRSKKTYELVQPVSIEILGTPNPDTLEMMRRLAGPEVGVSISPHYVGGFVRPVETIKGEVDGSAV